MTTFSRQPSEPPTNQPEIVKPCPPAARRLVLAATVLASSMIFIDGTVVTVALPAIREDLAASLAGAQWVMNAYVLMLAAFTLIGGAAADRFGRRRIFLLGVAAFCLTSAACATARSVELLVVARILQGLAGALLAPANLAVIGAVYPENERGAAIGLWAGASALATAGGPVLGGLIADYAHWSLIFLLNLPLGVAAGALAWRSLPESRTPGSAAPLDWPGALLAAAGFGAAAWALVSLGDASASATVVAAAAVVAIAGIAGFIAWEGGAAAPMMPLSLYKSAAFSGVTALTALLYAALSAAFFILPFALIESRGWSAAEAGAALLPFTFVLAALAGVAGRASDRWGPRAPLIAGAVLAATGFASVAAAPESAGAVLGVVVPMTVVGLGFAAAIAPLTSVALAAVPSEREGAASGVNNAAARAAGLVGTAIAAAVASSGSYGAAMRLVMAGAAVAALAGAVLAWATIPRRSAGIKP